MIVAMWELQGTAKIITRNTSRCGMGRTKPTTDSVARDVTPQICYHPFPFTLAKSCTIFAILSRAPFTADEMRLRRSKSFVEVSRVEKRRRKTSGSSGAGLRSQGVPQLAACRAAILGEATGIVTLPPRPRFLPGLGLHQPGNSHQRRNHRQRRSFCGWPDRRQNSIWPTAA